MGRAFLSSECGVRSLEPSQKNVVPLGKIYSYYTLTPGRVIWKKDYPETNGSEFGAGSGLWSR